MMATFRRSLADGEEVLSSAPSLSFPLSRVISSHGVENGRDGKMERRQPGQEKGRKITNCAFLRFIFDSQILAVGSLQVS